MKSRLIIIHGFASGGTNLLSHILQSHPEICSVRSEINELIGERSQFSPFDQWRMRNNLLISSNLQDQVSQLFTARKLSVLNDGIIGEKYKGVAYTDKEVTSSVTLIKGVHLPSFYDLSYSGFLSQMFDQVNHIVLFRNGFAICESWKRRKISPLVSGRIYSKFYHDVTKLNKNQQKFLSLRFEDILIDPFKVSSDLYRFLNLNPIHLKNLRFDVKKTISRVGEYKVTNGQERDKVWLDQTGIVNFIKSDIDSIQTSMLNAEDKSVFLKNSYDVMRKLGYLV